MRKAAIFFFFCRLICFLVFILLLFFVVFFVQEVNRITKDGYLVIRSDMTRKQILNQADCMNKLRKMIYTASVLPKELTQEEIKLKESRYKNR